MMKLTYELWKRGIRLRFAKSGVYDILGSKMYLDLKDTGISTDLILDRIREKDAVDYLITILNKDDVVMDIGANIGYYALLESRLTRKVYAIEPSPNNYESLKQNIRLNNYKNISVHKIAISDEIAENNFYIYRNTNANSFHMHKNKDIIDTIKVKTTTVDEFLKGRERPNIIRMDVEGHEYEIIKGMKHTLSLDGLTLFIEIHPMIMGYEKVLYILKTLKHFGFEITMAIRIFIHTKVKLISKVIWDYSYYNIDDFLKDTMFLRGQKGCYELFFKKH